MPKKGFGLKDGSQKGWLLGGSGRNRTSVCRFPEVKKARLEQKKKN